MDRIIRTKTLLLCMASLLALSHMALAQVSMVKDIFPGSDSSFPFSLTNVNGTLFFRANDGTNGGELWKSDGTASGTVMVKDIIPGEGGSFPSDLTNVNGTLFFKANDGTNGEELWKTGQITGIDGDEEGRPTEFALSQNYPNPFNPETVIEYALPKATEVSLKIYNLRGQEVALLINDTMPAGNHQVIWDASNMASGVYIYRLQAANFVQTRKMLLLK
ncbi:MAG: T9SS type A sorting domain-containing protein [Candidatus Marinimicrobia bacterium]|nr:T9SS type A sorting domain-containing protein [Candidatus Neomarinimicrobiota bacterium]